MEDDFMRMLLKASLDVEASNVAIKNGKLGELMESILGDLKPEAAYFVLDGGQRTALLFVDLDDPSQLPALAEPWFHAFNAEIECTPAMKAEDLMKAGPAIEAAVTKYA